MRTKIDELTADEWSGAAWLLNCDVPAMRAVAMVETGSFGAFYPDGKPMILYERHVFHRETAGRYATSIPDLSASTPGGYGAVSEQPHRLERASAFDRNAALKSCSWGAFQILGTNYARAGYSTVQGFVNAMYRGIDEHLRAFACFVHSDEVLERGLRLHNWPLVARWYNGPGYKGSPSTDLDDYDHRLAVAYQVALATGVPGPDK